MYHGLFNELTCFDIIVYLGIDRQRDRPINNVCLLLLTPVLCMSSGINLCTSGQRLCSSVNPFITCQKDFTLKVYFKKQYIIQTVKILWRASFEECNDYLKRIPAVSRIHHYNSILVWLTDINELCSYSHSFSPLTILSFKAKC